MKRLEINFKVIGIIIILFSFLEPDYFKANFILHTLFLVIRIVGIFLAILFFIVKQQILYVTLVVTLYYCIYGFSTYINSGDVIGLISNALPIWGFVICVEVLLRFYPIKGLFMLNFVYSSLVYVNILFFIIYPNGYTLYSPGNVTVVRYFLGVYNQFASVLIPAVVISVIYSLVRYNRITYSTKLLILAVCFTFIYFWSATSLIGISLIVAYLLFVHKGWLKYLINNKTIIISITLLFITVVYLNNLSIFSFIIEDLLNKDLTLSSRTRIWDIAISMINENTYFGYGYLEDGRYIYLNTFAQRDAHNTILQVLLQSGVFGLITFIFLILISFKRIAKYKSNPITKFILFSLLVSTTMMLSEVYPLHFLYLIILLVFFTPNIIKAKNKSEEDIKSYDLRRNK